MKAVIVQALIALCVLSASAGTAAQDRDDADYTGRQVRSLLGAGRYSDAESAAVQLCSRVEARIGPKSLEFARAQDLHVQALIRNGKANTSETIELAQRVIELKEHLVGVDDLEVAVSLDNLGTIRLQRGEALMALALHERALGIRHLHLESDDPFIADSYDLAAAALINLERFDEARTMLTLALVSRERDETRTPLALAGTVELLALLNRNTGNYSDAISYVGRAIAIRRRVSQSHPDLAPAVELRGDLLFLRGDVVGAELAWVDALKLSEMALGAEHPALVTSLRRLALAARSSGNLVDQRRFLERALRIADRSLAPCNNEVAALMSALGSSLQYYGEFAQAYIWYQRAQMTYQMCLGTGHSLFATLIHNQAELAATMGDLSNSERLHEKAISIWSRGLGPDHPYVARGLDALAEVVESRGQRERARVLYERALSIRRTAVGPDHPDVAWTLTNLGRVTAGSGHYKSALEYIQKAIDIFRRAGASDEPDHLARALELRGEVESRQGDFVSARASFMEALSTREQVFGQSHPLTAEARAQIASADFALGSHQDALVGALDAERAGRDQLKFTVRYLPERHALAYAEKRPKGLSLALSILADRRVNEPAVLLDAVIQSRAVVLDEFAARAGSAVGKDSALASLNTSLVAARQRFANLMLRSVGVGEGVVSAAMLEEARQQKEDAERGLAERSAAVRNELERANQGLDVVRQALPTDAALVSFVRYGRTSFVKAASRLVRRVTPSYIAFVTRPGDSSVVAVALGQAEVIDTLVGTWRTKMTGIVGATAADEAEGTYRVAAAALRQRIWDPLRKYLIDARTVFIVPDGSLNVVSFAALPIGPNNYLIDEGPAIHYLSAERDLNPVDAMSTASRGLLAVGGAAFNDASLFARAPKHAPAPSRAPPAVESVVASVRSSSLANLRAGCGTLQSMQFSSLAGTGREVHEVARLWTDSPAEILESRAANERAFKHDAPGHRVLHLATHGFFLGNDCMPVSSGTRSVGGLVSVQPSRAMLKPKPVAGGLSENPLLLSGLALAGANRRAFADPEEDDGILTAEEVSGLNLEGVEWVVLSACDTGLGEIRAGEGVFGLRRAFQVAGARTVIMSLWQVDDEATRIWMRGLYRNRLQGHLNTAEAMRAASLGVLRDRRDHGQTTHPFYWAAFVAAGDWR